MKERTFTITCSGDDIVEMNLDAVGEFIEWLEDEKGVKLWAENQQITSEYFKMDVSKFRRERLEARDAARVAERTTQITMIRAVRGMSSEN